MWKFRDIEEMETVKRQIGEMEFDWPGIDRLGQLAIFSSFNCGYTPDCITSSIHQFNSVVAIIEKLPDITNSIAVKRGPGKYDDWADYARQGLFAYDNDDVHSTEKIHRYCLLCKPEKPLLYHNIEALHAYKAVIPSFDLEFGDAISFEELRLVLIE